MSDLLSSNIQQIAHPTVSTRHPLGWVRRQFVEGPGDEMAIYNCSSPCVIEGNHGLVVILHHQKIATLLNANFKLTLYGCVISICCVGFAYLDVVCDEPNDCASNVCL